MKSLLFFLVLTLSSFTPLQVFGKNALRFEVLCPKTFSTLELVKLCTNQKRKCRWKKVSSSKNASSWVKRNQYKVIENPLMKGIKVEVLNPKLSGVRLPWCFSKISLNLPKKTILDELRATKETLYLLNGVDTHHLPRLKAIKHPCRVLRSVATKIENFKFYYLEPQKIKACELAK